MESITVVLLLLLLCSFGAKSAEILKFRGRVGHDGRLMADEAIPALSHQMTRFINALNTTWTATDNFDPDVFPVESFKRLLGVHPEAHKYRLAEHYHDISANALAEIPEEFDSREQWPECPSIREIRDQGSCGSCWAFGATEAMSDRTCIASRGKFQSDISAEDLLACCTGCGMGCNGGFPGAAWEYWVKSGLVTGGLYNSQEGCQPYDVPACEHHTKGPRGPCGKIVHTPKCVHMCIDGYNKSYTDDKIFGKKAYTVSRSVDQIQHEIMTNGPVEADFTVFSDFPNYKSGVYQRHSLVPMGGHAIRLLGWGKEQGVDYWLAANSWNTDWGDQGYFKIRRGHNECGIENDINAGLPDV